MTNGNGAVANIVFNISTSVLSFNAAAEIRDCGTALKEGERLFTDRPMQLLQSGELLDGHDTRDTPAPLWTVGVDAGDPRVRRELNYNGAGAPRTITVPVRIFDGGDRYRPGTLVIRFKDERATEYCLRGEGA